MRIVAAAAAVLLLGGGGVVDFAGLELGLENVTATAAACGVDCGGIESASGSLGRIRSRPCFAQWALTDWGSGGRRNRRWRLEVGGNCWGVWAARERMDVGYRLDEEAMNERSGAGESTVTNRRQHAQIGSTVDDGKMNNWMPGLSPIWLA